MAISTIYGFETGAALSEMAGAATGSGITFDTTTKRTGTYSLKLAAVSATLGNLGLQGSTGAIRAFVYFDSFPATARSFLGDVALGSVKVNTAGVLTFFSGVTQIATGPTLATGQWYRIEFRSVTTPSSGMTIAWVDGAAVNATGSPGSYTIGNRVGTTDTVAATFTCYYDDVANFTNEITASQGDAKVVLLLPTADSSVGAGWTLGTGTAISANSGAAAVDNVPPVGVADLAVGSDPKQIRNASTLNSYAASLATYSAAGIGASDTVNAVMAFVVHGAPSATSPKTGTLALTNPTIAATAFGTTNYYSGVVAGTFPTGWTRSRALNAAPSVTLGTNPVITAAVAGTAARIAMLCFMGAYVDYTPGVAAANPSDVVPRRQYHQLIAR